MKRSTGRTVLIVIGVLVVLAILVTVPMWIYESNNPPVVREPAWPSPQVKALAVRACFDCHSNQTQWPWFTKLPGGAQLAVLDTFRGRRRLNFSDWGAARGEGGEGFEARRGGDEGRGGGGEYARVIENGSMPPANYTMLHPNAVLNDQEKQQLMQGLQALGR